MKTFMIIFKDGTHKIVNFLSMKDLLNAHCTMYSFKYKSITEL